MALLTSLIARIRGFVRSDAGVSAVEFALILPVMLLLYGGCVELSEALAVDRKANRVASTICDLVSQKTNITATEMTNIFNASSAIMEPYSSGTELTMQLIVVDVASSSQTVNWSKARNGTTISTPYANGATSPVTIPSTIAVVGTQVIVAKITYTFTSPFSSLMKSITGKTSYTLNHTFMMRPRLGTSITYG